MHRDAATMTLLGILAACLGAAAASAGDGESYRKELELWRRQREADLKADDGWLTVCGLSWLRPGETRIGSDPSNDVLLPPHAPATVGLLTLDADGGRASFRPAPGVAVTRNGRPFESGAIHSDADERPDILAVGDVRLILLRRGERMALRIKDNRSAARARFAGLRWYPAKEDWRIRAKFVAYPTPAKLTFDTIVGERETLESPGYATFDRGGKTCRLQAARVKGGGLWFVFRDATSGRTTHGGARQLTADPPRGDEVVLDFNKAVNLPCAYIPFATCPLAPPQNRLGLAIEAGEKMYEPDKAVDTDTAAR
jgi:uncharacterized protein (DUF1684 family)